MRQATRTARHDPALNLEAYSLRGLSRPFPCHLHDYYVIGVVERGTRVLTCGGRRQVIGPGDVLLFNPGDSHGCVQEDGVLDYRGLNIPRDTMLALTEEVMDSWALPGFSVPVVRNGALADRLRTLHRAVLENTPALHREEALLLAFSRLLSDCAGPESAAPLAGRRWRRPAPSSGKITSGPSPWRRSAAGWVSASPPWSGPLSRPRASRPTAI